MEFETISGISNFPNWFTLVISWDAVPSNDSIPLLRTASEYAYESCPPNWFNGYKSG